MCALADEVVGRIIYITGLVYIKYSLSTVYVGVMLYIYTQHLELGLEHVSMLCHLHFHFHCRLYIVYSCL